MRFSRSQSILGSACGRPLLLAPACAVFLSLAIGCDRPAAPSPDQATQAAAPEPPQVRVDHPRKQDVRRKIERPGYNIEPDERTLINAKITGYVAKWNYDIGAPVDKGAVLAELYVPEMKVELEQKKAAVEQAASEIKQAEAGVLRARAEEKRAKSQYERLSRLKSVIDQDQVEEYRLGYEAAQAAVDKAKADEDVARARLKVAETARDYVQTLLEYTKIRAPYTGVVTERKINLGDFVQPAAATKGEALFVMERTKPVRVFINVQELDAVWVRPGDAALIRVQGLQGEQFEGTVTRTSQSLSPQNRTLRTEIDLPNKEGKLLTGSFVNATIIAERKGTWSLPAAAVVTKDETAFCYRIEDGRAVRTPIQVGLRGGDLVEVLKKRTKPGKGLEAQWEDFSGEEVIVVSDPTGLTDGQAVSISSSKK
jgi:RND family efflux transporter MFP subunit